MVGPTHPSMNKNWPAIMEMGKEDGRYVNPKTFTSDLFFLSFPLCPGLAYMKNCHADPNEFFL